MSSLAKGVFLGCVIIFSFFQLAGFASAATIYVNGSNSGTENGTSWATGWSTIQEGINNATEGDTVNVSAGTYTENVIVNVSVNLIGAGIDATTISASNKSDHVINVSINNVNVSGFTVTGTNVSANKAGVYIGNADYVKIESVYSNDTQIGIELENSDNVTIANNTFYQSSENDDANYTLYGVKLYNSDNNTITNNSVSVKSGLAPLYDFAYSYGFSLRESGNNTISNNNATNFEYGFAIEEDSHFNNLSNNNFLGKLSPLGDIFGFSINLSNSNTLINNTAFATIYGFVCGSPDYYGVYIEDGKNNIISSGTFYDNGFSIYIGHVELQPFYPENNSIIGNEIYDSCNGIYLFNERDGLNLSTLVANNTVYRISGCGVMIRSSFYRSVIENNTIKTSGKGICRATNSYDDIITKNTIINNSQVGLSFSSNSIDNANTTIYNNLFNNSKNFLFYNNISTYYWNITKTLSTNIVGGSYIAGNFWAYPNGTGFSETCADNDFDGICDSSYSLVADNTDYLPLTEPTPSTMNVTSPENTTYSTISITLNVTTNLPSNVTYSLNGANNVSLYNDSTQGNKTITASEGLNNITVYANDSLGDYNSTTVYFTVDTITPVVFTNLTNNTYNYQNFKIEFNATDTNLESLWHDNGTGNSTYQTSNHTFNINYTSDGLKSITFYANDSAGNLNETAVLFTVESKPPALYIISPQNTSYSTTQIYLNVSADEPTDAWWYQYNGNGTNITFTPNATFFAGENGLKNIAVYANDTAGNENSTTIYFTMNIPSETPPPSGGGGGGGSSGTYVLVKEILPGGPAKFIFPEGKAETAIIPEIELIANSKVYNTKITLELQKKNPTRIEPSGETYKWMSIRCSLSDRLIDEADITFKIEKQWLKENDIDPNTVTMERQISSSELESLETTKIQSNDTYVTFSAKTKGFSYFAMSGEKGSGYGEDTAKKFDPALAELMMNISKTTKPPETTLPPTLETPPPSTEETPNGGSYVLTVIILFALLAALVGVGLLKRKNKF